MGNFFVNQILLTIFVLEACEVARNRTGRYFIAHKWYGSTDYGLLAFTRMADHFYL